MAAEDDADFLGVTRLLLPYCSLIVSPRESFLSTSDCSALISAVLCSQLYMHYIARLHARLQVTHNSGRLSSSELDDERTLLRRLYLTTVVLMISG
jgi:hypothetical protein